jgi:CRP-like cAMP-binding protein
VLFDSLTAEQISQLCDAVIRRRLDPGETVFEQGSNGAALYVIRSGVYEIARTDEDGDCTKLGRVGPGEYVGEISMMTGDPRPGTVMALSSGEVLELPKSAIEALLSGDDTVSAALERSVLRSLKRFDRDPNLRDHVVPDGRDTLAGRIRNFLAVSAA